MKKPLVKSVADDLSRELLEICTRSGTRISRKDTDITIFVAMTETARRDLLAMLRFLQKSMSDFEVIHNVFHDLRAFKDIYLNPKAHKGWSPRSYNYYEQVQNLEVLTG